MAGDRTLKLSILADVSNLASSLNKGTKEVEGFGTQISNISEKAVKAFAAIGAATAAMAVSLVKAAAEDEASRRKLTEQIEASTNASQAQIATVEDYISKTALAVGVTDDKLRPALARLIRSTKDTDEAQKLLNLALDITAATGKGLPQVADALGKAYDGNTNALGRLGLGLDQNLIKSKDMDKIYQELQKTFGNFAENEAATLEGKFRILNIAMDESKEALGAALLPAAEQLSDWIIGTGVPALTQFIESLTGQAGATPALNKTEKAADAWGKKVRSVIETVVDLKEVILVTAGVMTTIFVVSKVAAAVQGTIVLINSVIAAYNALKASAIAAGVAQAFALNPLLGVGAVALAAGVLAGINALEKKNEEKAAAAAAAPNLGSRPLGGIPGIGSTTVSTVVDTTGLTNVTKPATTATNAANTISNFNAGSFRMGEAATMNEYNITINGALDKGGVANQIKDLLTNEATLSGNYSGGIGSSRFIQATL